MCFNGVVDHLYQPKQTIETMEYHGHLKIVKQMYQRNNPRYYRILDLDLCDEPELDIVGSPYAF